MVTKTGAEARELKMKIADESIEFIPVYLAKGLEYDAVIVASEKGKSFSRDEANLPLLLT